MSEEDTLPTMDRSDGRDPTVDDAIRTTEAYETDEGVVLYDAENPLAWVQSPNAVRLDDAA
jgi:hypothetical protein